MTDPMNAERRVEWEAIREKAEAARWAFERVEQKTTTVRICLDPTVSNDDELAAQRHQLAKLCRELIERVEALAKHAQG